MIVFCQAVVVVVFGWSAVTKLAGRAAFADFRRWLVTAVRVPPWVAGPVVAAEAATAGAVLLAPGPGSFAPAALLMAVLTVAVAAMWRRRVTVPCRCFGAGRYPPGPVPVARNLAVLLIAVAGAVSSSAGGVPAAVAGAAAALLLIDLDDIVVVVRRPPATRTTIGG